MCIHSRIWVVCNSVDNIDYINVVYIIYGNSYVMGARDVWHLLQSLKSLCCRQTLPHVGFWVCE